MDPLTIAIISEGIRLGASAIGSAKDKKLRKKLSKERKRQTESDLLNQSLSQSAENEEEGMRSSRRLGKRRTEALRNTAASVRGALV